MPLRVSLRRVVAGPKCPIASLAIHSEASAREGTEPGPFRVLVAHLFACFFASDLPASSAQPTTLTLQIAAALGMPPVLFVFSLVPSYSGTSPWLSLRPFWLQAQDHFILVMYACAVVGIATLLKWDRFFPTLLDVRILTLLPISNARLFAAKVLAIVIFLCVFLVGANLPASLVLVGIAGAPSAARHLAAHLLAIGCAGSFTAAAVLVLMSLAGLLPERVRRPAAALLQGSMLAVLILALFFSPLIASSAHLLVSSHPSIAIWLPPFWFVGIYEGVLHAAPESHLFGHLASIGALATVAGAILLLILYPLAYRRKTAELLEGQRASPRKGNLFRALPAHLLRPVLRSPLQTASFHFVGQTVFSIQRFRVSFLLATCSGIALAAMLVARFRITGAFPYLIPAHLRPVSMILVLLLAIACSMYVSLSTNLDAKATWIFESTLGRWEPAITSGVRRWACLILSAVAASGVLIVRSLTPTVHMFSGTLARELLLASCVSVLLTEMFFYAFRDIPFTMDRLRRQGMAATVLVCLFLIFPLCLVAIEGVEGLLTRSWLAMFLCFAVVILTYWVLRRHERRMEFSPPSEPEDASFQRLGL